MYADGTMKLDYKSCEMMSDDLYVADNKEDIQVGTLR